MEETRVAISLEEYKEFIISQYQQGQIKKTLVDEIKELESRKELLKMEVDKILTNKNEILSLTFKFSEMDYRSRKSQILLGGYESGISDRNIEVLKKLGFTEQEMIDYINEQWDLKEAQDSKEAEEENE